MDGLIYEGQRLFYIGSTRNETVKGFSCAVDLGSNLCHVLVGRFINDGEIELLGCGSAPSHGVKTGAIINIEAAAQSISEAVREAELMSGIPIEKAMINVSGKHLQSDNSRGVVAVTNKERIVSSADVLRVIEGAQNIRIQAEQDMLHVLSREFSLDNQNGIRDPVGMSGIRLEAEVHIVTAGITALTNLNKALRVSGIELLGGVMSSLASAEALLQTEEKDLGVAVIDIGGGITDIILYVEGGVCYSSVVPLGGIHITQDTSIGLKLPVEAAEFIKKNYGSTNTVMVDPTEKIELPSTAGRPPRHIPRQQLVEIMEARLREIFEMVDAKLVQSGQKSSLSGGVILTGGCSLLEGIEELAENILGLNVSVRGPYNISGFSDRVDTPEYSTAVGVLHYMQRMGRKNSYDNEKLHSSSLIKRLKNWILENV